MERIIKYFPSLSDTQRSQYAALGELYKEWNAKINVISRKDIDDIYEHHVLHSLAIAEVVQFQSGARVMDLGTGGGFPGIPLAIMFPDVRFHLVDSIGKKVRVAQEVAHAIGLTNVEFSHIRGENITDRDYDFVVTRAVMPLTNLLNCIGKTIKSEQQHALPNGILALKGGELDEEIAPMRRLCTTWDISNWFDEPWFETKKVVHVTVMHTK